MYIAINCQNCNQKLRIPAIKGTLKVTCPICRSSQIWESDSNREKNKNQSTSYPAPHLTEPEPPITPEHQQTKRKPIIIRRDRPPNPPPQSISSKKEKRERATELKTALNETKIIRNQEIALYLQQHPETDSIGKFGLPQDKYRWGFYGHASMAYDIWRRGDKH